jgi:hypothetical protein
MPTCSVPTWSTCDLAFDLEAGENSAPVQLHGEFRSAKRTLLIQSFREGDRRYVLRFAPTEPGEWDYRLTSNLKRLDGQLGKAIATPSESPGFVKVANVHHFAYEGTKKQHLWMSTAIEDFVRIPRTDFDRTMEQRVGEKFTHLRVTIAKDADLNEAAERIRAINARGVVADVVLDSISADRVERERYIADIAARFSAFNITWMGAPVFENIPNGKSILKDAGTLLAKLDPYNHPRTSMAEATSSPLLGDQWMTFLSYGTADPNVGAVEHQFYGMPAVNTGIQSERDLWNATMNGQYPASGSGKYMTAWFDFMSGNRYWELEPYFDVDGGRAVALEDVEYIVCVEKPGPVELRITATTSSGSIRKRASASRRRITKANISPASLRTNRMTGCCEFRAKGPRRGCCGPTSSTRGRFPSGFSRWRRIRRRCRLKWRRPMETFRWHCRRLIP